MSNNNGIGDFNFYDTIYYSGNPNNQLAAAYLHKIIDFDMQSINNLTVAAGLLVRADMKGIDVANEAGNVQSLLNKNTERQTYVEQQNIFDIKVAEHDTEFQRFVEDIAEGRSNFGAAVITMLGITIGIKYLIGASIITGAVVTYTIIRRLQTHRNESEIEFDQSRRVIQDILNKLDDKDKNILVHEIDSQLKSAYRSGKRKQFWSTWGGIIRASGYIVVGAIAVVKGVPYVARQYKKERKKLNK